MKNLTLLLAVTAFVAGCGRSKKNGDDEPPVAGQNLAVTTAGTTSVHLSWSAATDDETPAAELEYLAFYSLANDLNGVAAVEENGTANGTYAAAITDVEVAGLSPDLAYYFSVLVRDRAGNRAAYSAVPALTMLPCAAATPAGGCPAATPGKFTLCGRLSDAQTDEHFEAAAATGAACSGTPTAAGPCSVEVRFFDALAFASNPSGATPIVPQSFVLDDCGRYRASNLEPPGTAVVAIVVDDAVGTTDRHRTSSVLANSSRTDLRSYVVRNETDAAWSTSAGLAGPTFADLGVAAVDFRYQGVGRGGVALTRNGGAATADDYYFSDVGPTRNTVDAARLVTGSNGTALVLNAALDNYGGIGGEPPGCEWIESAVLVAPGVVLFFANDAVVTGGGVTPCP